MKNPFHKHFSCSRLRRFALSMVVILALLPDKANAQWNPWIVANVIAPSNVSYDGYAVTDSFQYLIGGLDANMAPTGLVHRKRHRGGYGWPGAPWTPMANMSIPRFGAACAATPNGKLYTFGGCTSGYVQFCVSNFVEEFDPITNTWTVKASMPTPRIGANAVYAHGLIYVIGGANALDSAMTTVEAFDPLTNTWSTKAPMTVPRVYFGSAIKKNLYYWQPQEIFVAGGVRDYFGYFTNPTAHREKYNPLTNTWTAMPPLPSAAFGFGMDFGFQNELNFAGGYWMPTTGNVTGDPTRLLVNYETNSVYASWYLDSHTLPGNFISQSFKTTLSADRLEEYLIGVSISGAYRYCEYHTWSVFPANGLTIKAEKVGSFVKLRWTSGNESTHSFILSRRAAQESEFSAISSKIAAREGSENYEFVDIYPKPGKTEYRLTAYDVNGNEVESAIEVIQLDGTPFAQIRQLGLSKEVQIRYLIESQNMEGAITINGIDGKTIASKSLDPKAQETTMDLGAFSAGVYFATFRLGATYFSQKFILR